MLGNIVGLRVGILWRQGGGHRQIVQRGVPRTPARHACQVRGIGIAESFQSAEQLGRPRAPIGDGHCSVCIQRLGVPDTLRGFTLGQLTLHRSCRFRIGDGLGAMEKPLLLPLAGAVELHSHGLRPPGGTISQGFVQIGEDPVKPHGRIRHQCVIDAYGFGRVEGGSAVAPSRHIIEAVVRGVKMGDRRRGMPIHQCQRSGLRLPKRGVGVVVFCGIRSVGVRLRRLSGNDQGGLLVQLLLKRQAS